MRMSAFGGKADMIYCGNPLLQSLLGAKRTWAVAPHMSAFDPKRTSSRFELSEGSSLAYSLHETLPTAAEVTSMAPPVAPNRTGVRIHGRCRVHAWCCIDRIFFNDHWRRRYNHRPTNHDGSRLLDNDRRRSSVLVAWNFTIARYRRQIGGHCWRGKS
jgi:hypothetical protein